MLRLLSRLALFSLDVVEVYACGGYGDICPEMGTPQFAEQTAAD